LNTLGAFFDGEFYTLALIQFTVPLGLDGAVVDENIFALISADKAIALVGIEPFHGSNNTFIHLSQTPFLQTFSLGFSAQANITSASVSWGLFYVK
jgi:hypothetical protein